MASSLRRQTDATSAPWKSRCLTWITWSGVCCASWIFHSVF